jgi:phosphohistidine phosphatase
MKLYLVQHGESKQETEDPVRPLTGAGRKSVEQVGRHLARTALFSGGLAVCHSGKLRAKQTAEILASLLGVSGPPLEVGGLAPNDPPEAALELVQRSNGDLMLVGHLPHLSRLASLLLVGTAEQTVVRFRMGGVVCLGRDDAGAWALEWMLVPELAPP